MKEFVTTFPFAIRAEDSGVTGWHHHWGADMGHMIFGSTMMLLFWGAVVLLTIFIVRWFLKGREDDASRTAAALNVLVRRFVNGEIDETEYEAGRKALSK